jgi:hypothetical protein
MYCIVKTSPTRGGGELSKNKKYGTYYMEPENIEKMEQYEKETGAKKSAVVNMALKEFFKKQTKK